MKLTIKNQRKNRTQLLAALSEPNEKTDALEVKVASRGRSYIGDGATVTVPLTREAIETLRATCDAAEANLDKRDALRAQGQARLKALALLVPPNATLDQRSKARRALQLAELQANRAATPQGIVAQARTIMAGETA